MKESAKEHLGSVLDFRLVNDPRLDRKKEYPLDEILFLTICAVTSGFSDWEEIADFGTAKQTWLRQYLPYKNGIPSHDTINRVMGLIDHREFESFFIAWVEGVVDTLGGKLINVDGKKLRSSVDKRLQNKPKSKGGKSAVHLVEAWCSELGMCLGQYKTEDKSNEITAIPALLNLLEICGCIITIDAMGCQKDIAEIIVGKGADYILGLKGNQEKIHHAVQLLFKRHAGVIDTSVEEYFGHGRGEIRTCRVLSASLLDESILSEWKGLTTLIEIYSERAVWAADKGSMEYRYYLGSKDQSAAIYNTQIREHWGIENKLHWSMDVTFGEDKSRKRAGNAAQNFGIIRRLALNLLKNNGDKPLVSIKRRMNKAALDDEYRMKTLRF
jgi:predicted transposase YbfD/YdcC